MGVFDGSRERGPVAVPGLHQEEVLREPEIVRLGHPQHQIVPIHQCASGRARDRRDEAGDLADRVEVPNFEPVHVDVDGEGVLEKGDQLEHAERVDNPAREQRRVVVELASARPWLELRLDERPDPVVGCSHWSVSIPQGGRT